jgi:isopenicillin N synthase-like dioxygenase
LLAQDILEYREEILQLGRVLLGWIQQNAPQNIRDSFPEPLSGALSSKASLLPALHYPPLSGSEMPEAVRAAAHEDINLITLLPVSHQSGLQVKSRNGEWLNLETSTGELIVNVGNMLQRPARRILRLPLTK